MLKIINFIECSKDVYDGYVGLYAVYGIEDKSALLGEDIRILTDLFPYLLLGTKRKDMLCIDTSTPETDITAEFGLESLEIHIPGGKLDRIQNIYSTIDKVWNENIDRPAVMHHDSVV